MTIYVFHAGTKVRSTLSLECTGTIVGHSILAESDETRLVYLVRLDRGVWDNTHQLFISVLVCDASSIEEI